MLNTLGIVEVMTPAPEEPLAPNLACDPVMLAQSRFAGTSRLEWIIRRVTDAQRRSGLFTKGATIS